jgi:hypothetical protein
VQVLGLPPVQAGTVTWQAPMPQVIVPVPKPAQGAAWQKPLAQVSPAGQSASRAHVTHGAQGPPQSTPVSAPFCTPSSQLGTWQTALEQTPLAQSAATPQPTPAAHAGHAPPPQSTPVSAPFRTPSLQVGAWQEPATHTPLAQS